MGSTCLLPGKEDLHCRPLPGAEGMLGFIPPAMIGPA
jgi:hypothetical protein